MDKIKKTITIMFLAAMLFWVWVLANPPDSTSAGAIPDSGALYRPANAEGVESPDEQGLLESCAALVAAAGDFFAHYAGFSIDLQVVLWDELPEELHAPLGLAYMLQCLLSLIGILTISAALGLWRKAARQ